MNIRERLDRAKQLEYVTVQDGALLVGVSIKTIRRRLPRLTGATDLLRNGRILRVKRLALLRLFAAH